MAFTEFYCDPVNGLDINAGSTTAAATHTATNSNWSTATKIYTPTDGSTPTTYVNVGDWVSIYVDGATTAVFVARVTAVAAGVNGGITVAGTTGAAGTMGTAPTTSATGRSLTVG